MILILLEKVPAALFDLWGGVGEIKGRTRISGVKARNHRMQSKSLIFTVTRKVSRMKGNMRNGTFIIIVSWPQLGEVVVAVGYADKEF